MVSNKNNKGLVLVAILWIVVVLTVIVTMLGRKSRLDSKITLARMDAVRCKWACRAGIERAIAILNEDERETDCLTDLWNYSPDDFNDFQLERCQFNVRVIDESSKLNVNTAMRDQLLGLPYMTEDVADAIIDWRDTDEDPGLYGVEGGYYENLTFGYLPRNDSFRTLRELLLVRGVTEELFYGEDTNLNGRLDYNEMDGDTNPPSDNMDAVLDKGWAAYLTCYPIESSSGTTQTTQDTTTQTESSGGDGLVNINTASDVVLAALLGGTNEAYVIANAIIAYRNTLESGIADPSELTEVGILTSDIMDQIQDYITVSSNIFTIRCVATTAQNGPYGTTLQTEVVVNRSSSPYEVLYWYQGASN
jgi:type II secretory pathway component PulK